MLDKIFPSSSEPWNDIITFLIIIFSILGVLALLFFVCKHNSDKQSLLDNLSRKYPLFTKIQVSVRLEQLNRDYFILNKNLKHILESNYESGTITRYPGNKLSFFPDNGKSAILILQKPNQKKWITVLKKYFR